MSPTIRTDFPYPSAHEDVWIPVLDGVRLFARVWRPVTDAPVPALLEYLPSRLSDRTAPRDRQRHPWYAGHGYASVRVDARGYGNSQGLPGDRYGAAELGDGVEVINWLSAQPWCTGAVGLFGLSSGGSDSLRLAALAPAPLKAVVTVCSTDDGYDNDAHYLGGSVLAVDMHARAAALLAFAAGPPDPLYVGDAWRAMWLARLEAVEPLIHTWLNHQTRDAYWRRGGVREEYGAIQAPVLAVGGWHDPYRDTVLRLVEHLDPARVRGVIGPWSHQYPDQGLPPGPAVGFLQETLRWWDQHLKGVPTGVMEEPLLRAWISASHPPATSYPELPGRWVGADAWPSPRITPVSYAFGGAPVIVDSPHHTGVDAGRFVPAGQDADLPPDQREEDARSVCFEFPVAGVGAGEVGAGGQIEILGRPRVRLRLRLDVPAGQAIARLCDVAPDGSSTLVTRGALNLSARHGRERADPWQEGATEDVTFELNGIGHTFPPGHRIRLAVSSAYWPWIWPRADSSGFTLDPVGSFLELPVRAPGGDEGISFGPAEQSEALNVAVPVTLDEPRPERLVVRDVAGGVWRLEVDPCDGATRVHPNGLELTEEARETYTIQEADPLSAEARSHWAVRLHRPDLGWDTRIETRSGMSCDAEVFVTLNELVCHDGDEVVFHRTWEERVPRTAG